jgi:outer membrane protein TolC
VRPSYSFTSSRIRALFVSALIGISSAGCAIHTAPPVAAVHQTDLVGWDTAAFSEQAYDPRWWQQLDDAVLEQLETAALGANHDVRSAVARLDAARAVFDEDRRGRYPKVTVGADIDVRDQAIPGFFDKPLRVNTYRAGFDAS